MQCIVSKMLNILNSGFIIINYLSFSVNKLLKDVQENRLRSGQGQVEGVPLGLHDSRRQWSQTFQIRQPDNKHCTQVRHFIFKVVLRNY